MLAGAFCEVILVLAIVGTAVALYPVGLRTLEAGLIATGVVPLLAVVTLRQHLAGTASAVAARATATHALTATLQSAD